MSRLCQSEEGMRVVVRGGGVAVITGAMLTHPEEALQREAIGALRPLIAKGDRSAPWFDLCVQTARRTLSAYPHIPIDAATRAILGGADKAVAALQKAPSPLSMRAQAYPYRVGR